MFEKINIKNNREVDVMFSPRNSTVLHEFLKEREKRENNKKKEKKSKLKEASADYWNKFLEGLISH